jgi:hypothetical protein
MSHYVLITGGRKYDDRDSVEEVLTFLHLFYGTDLRVMHGAARGADSLARDIARARDIPERGYPADWGASPRGAGAIRNRQMAELLVKWRRAGHTVQCVAFRGGNGTADMIEVARSHDIDVDEML